MSDLKPRTLAGIGAAATLIAAVIAANWATTKYGFIPVGFGQAATAGTLAAGLALAARDALQDTLGRTIMLAVLAAAAIVSYAVAAPAIATASIAAFLISELLDFAVYTPIRERSVFGDRRWAVAVVASSVVGILADTVVFLGIAFGAAAILPALLGQLIGKGWATIAYLILGKAGSAVLRKPLRQPESA